VSATVDAQRLRVELGKLASFSEAPAPAITRIVFNEMDLRARAYLKTLFAEASLVVHEDPVGNTFARWIGLNPALPPVATGSHCDAIPNAGRFDGTVGVLGGLEAIRALQRSGFKPRHSIELVLFTSEEPTRFGIGCLGSRLLAAALDPSVGDTLMSDGQSLNEVRKAAGFPGSLTDVPLRAGAYAAFVELHIEQGPILEREQLDVGIVTAIAAPASFRIFVEGEGGHAGAVLMPDRHDAFLAAGKWRSPSKRRLAPPGPWIPWRRPACARSSRARSTVCPARRGWRSTSGTSITHGAIPCSRTSRARATAWRPAAA